MTARYILKASVFYGGIIQPAPAGEMSHRNGSCPIGIILVPGYNSALFCRFGKQLVVPESDRPVVKELTGRHQKTGIPQHIMKSRSDAPGAKRMEKNLVWVR